MEQQPPAKEQTPLASLQLEKEQLAPEQLRLKKRKRRHRKAKVQRDPQEIKELKLQRIYQRREGDWNSRFINDTIPDLFRTRHKRAEHFRKPKSPLHTAYVEREGRRLPNLTTKDTTQPAKLNQKAFKIRSVTKKETQAVTISKQQQTAAHEEKVSKRERAKQRLLSQLEERTVIYPTNPAYKRLLIHLIERATLKKHRELRQILEREIATIGEKSNVCTIIAGMIKERRALLKKGTEVEQGLALSDCIELQVISLALVEEILKYKARWEEQYHEMNQPQTVNFQWQGSNYLITMQGETKDLPGPLDPFLVARTSQLQRKGAKMSEQELREQKEMALKIRACQLLLIQEELSSNK